LGASVKHFREAELDYYGTIRKRNSHNETNEKGSGEIISPHSHYIFIKHLNWPRVIWKMDSGVLCHIGLLYVPTTNSQPQNKRMLIVIHFNPSRLFFCRDILLVA